jgi:hypothetical protein
MGSGVARVATVLALVLLAASAVLGQPVGSVSGVITDRTGSAVPGATVRITETDKGTVHTATSNTEGRYTLPNLPVGPYRLEVQMNGFKHRVQTGTVLQVAENITQNVALQVGAMTETVEVHAAAKW